jgi:hypothetical protein
MTFEGFGEMPGLATVIFDGLTNDLQTEDFEVIDGFETGIFFPIEE